MSVVGNPKKGFAGEGMVDVHTHGQQAPAAQVFGRAEIKLPQEDKKFLPSNTRPAQMAVLKRWTDPNQTLRVCFLNGTDGMRRIVRELVLENWKPLISLQFDFQLAGSPDPEAEVRIKFDPNDGHWAYIATDYLTADRGQKTMNLGLRSEQDFKDPYNRGVVLHEFGHVRGFVHEHSSPASKIRFDVPKTITFFTQTYHWTEQMVEENVLKRYSLSEIPSTMFTDYDPTSIMIYSLPKELDLNGVGANANSTLSENDKRFVSKLYPRKDLPAPTATNETGGKLPLDGTDVKGAVGKTAKSQFTLELSDARELTLSTSGRTQVQITLTDSTGSAVSPTASVTPDLINESQYFKKLSAGKYRVEVTHLKGVDRGTLEFSIRAEAGDKRGAAVVDSKLR
jgi:hypothetical protein